MSLFIPLMILPHGKGLPLPAYATPQSAGMDLGAAIDAPRLLAPLSRILIETGLQIGLPAGYEAQVRPRSGLALKEGVTVLNSPGTIDADYRGEIKVLLINLGDKPVMIERGMRIAQLVIAPVTQGAWQEVSFFDESLVSERKEGGFGSTGV